MTENLKNSLKIVLDCYKEDKMTEQEAFTILEAIFNNSSSGGSTIVTYPINYPVYPNWQDIMYKPYCSTSTNTTSTFDNSTINKVE